MMLLLTIIQSLYSIYKNNIINQIKESYISESNPTNIKIFKNIQSDECYYDQNYNDINNRFHSIEHSVCIYRCTFNSIGTFEYNGGAILVFFYEVTEEETIIENCSFENCYSTNGGAIYLCSKQTAAQFQITYSNFSNNYVTSNNHPYGGALNLIQAQGSIKFCNFNHNYAYANTYDLTTYGGAIHFDNNSIISFTNCTFYDNYVSSIPEGISGHSITIYGGAVSCYLSTASFYQCKFINNTSTSSEKIINGAGGAVLAFNSSANFVRCQFINNSVISNESSDSSTLLGGAIVLYNTHSIINSCEFYDNFLSSNTNMCNMIGGAIYVEFETVQFMSCKFQNNSANIKGKNIDVSGGSIEFKNSIGSVDICTFIDNKIYSYTEDGIYNNACGGCLSFKNSEFQCTSNKFNTNLAIITGNDIKSAGGAIFVSQSTLYIKECNFTNNTVYSNLLGTMSYAMGGSVYFENSKGWIQNSRFLNCSAFSEEISDSEGSSFGNSGSLHIVISSYDIISCIFENNQCCGSGYDSSGLGGAAIFQNSDGDFTCCKFINCTTISKNNKGQSSGGSLFIRQSYGIIEECTFDQNCAYSYGSLSNTYGGSIYLFEGNITFKKCNFSDNFAFEENIDGAEGGSICLISSDGYFLSSIFSNNYILTTSSTSNSYGGGICLKKSNGTINECTFTNNDANFGCDLCFNQDSKEVVLDLQKSYFFQSKLENEIDKSIICYQIQVVFDVVHQFIDNHVVISGLNMLVFYCLTSSKMYWNVRNNCLYPYKSNHVGHLLFYPISSNQPYGWNDIFTNICAVPTFDFTQSNSFTESNTFTKSKSFTESNIFTLSDYLMFSNTFSPSPSQSSIPKEAMVSKSLSITEVNVKTVIFSYSDVSSNTFLLTYIPECDTYSYIFTNSIFKSYLPYIIYSVSYSLVPTYFAVELGKKSKVTGEMLIGIVCGACSLFFIILSIIIFAYSRKNAFNNFINEEMSVSTNDSENKEETHNGLNIENNIENNNEINWL